MEYDNNCALSASGLSTHVYVKTIHSIYQPRGINVLIAHPPQHTRYIYCRQTSPVVTYILIDTNIAMAQRGVCIKKIYRRFVDSTLLRVSIVVDVHRYQRDDSRKAYPNCFQRHSSNAQTARTSDKKRDRSFSTHLRG